MVKVEQRRHRDAGCPWSFWSPAAGLPQGDAGGKTQLALVTELRQAGAHVVVAGDTASAKDNGIVGLVRGDDTDKGAVSTVDNADSSLGEVSTVLAMAAAADSRFGHFGTRQGCRTAAVPHACRSRPG